MLRGHPSSPEASSATAVADVSAATSAAATEYASSATAAADAAHVSAATSAAATESLGPVDRGRICSRVRIPRLKEGV